jgi:hypothetical protein
LADDLVGPRREVFAICDLDQIPAGIVENRCGHGTHLDGLLREPDSEFAEALELSAHSIDSERRERDAIAC